MTNIQSKNDQGKVEQRVLRHIGDFLNYYWIPITGSEHVPVPLKDALEFALLDFHREHVNTYKSDEEADDLDPLSASSQDDADFSPEEESSESSQSESASDDSELEERPKKRAKK